MPARRGPCDAAQRRCAAARPPLAPSAERRSGGPDPTASHPLSAFEPGDRLANRLVRFEFFPPAGPLPRRELANPFPEPPHASKGSASGFSRSSKVNKAKLKSGGAPEPSDATQKELKGRLLGEDVASQEGDATQKELKGVFFVSLVGQDHVRDVTQKELKAASANPM